MGVSEIMDEIGLDGKYHISSSSLLWSPSILDYDDFLFNVEDMTQHEEEESMW